MTATDELRRLLDERGVEWRYKDERTTYWYGTLDGKEWGEWTAIEMGDYLHLTFSANGDTVTPEEAIAATLGSVSEKDSERVSEKGSERRGRAEETECIDTRCYGDPHGGEVYHIHVMECSACGRTFEHVNGSYEFCPRCGRKVVDG